MKQHLGKIIGLTVVIIAPILLILPFRIWAEIAFVLLLLAPMVWICFRWDVLRNEKELLNSQVQDLMEKNIDLEKKRDELETIFNRLDSTIFSYRLPNKQLYVSEGVEDLYVYSKEQLTIQPSLLKEVVHPDDLEKFHEKQRLLRSGERVKFQHRVLLHEGTIKWVEVTAEPIFGPDGEVEQIIGDAKDISRQKQLEEALRQMAYYDELTDLPNRQLIHKHLKKAIARSKRHDHSLAIMFMDLDGFKQVNDTLGHECGDKLLIMVGERLNEAVREEDLIGRLGGDEFIIVFEETTKGEIEGVCERIVEAISSPYTIDGEEVRITPSLGISIYPEHGEDMESLIKNADKAMYHAKNTGKGKYYFYYPDLETDQSKKFPMFEKIMESVAKLTRR